MKKNRYMKRLILTIGILSSILQGCQLTEVDGYVGGIADLSFW